MVDISDLKVYSTTDGNGGAITGFQIVSGIPNNVFQNIPRDQLDSGVDLYQCIYLKNTHPTEAMDNFKFWMSDKSFPRDTTMEWGGDPNQSSVQTIPNGFTEPSGVSWHGDFTQPDGPNTDIEWIPGAKWAVWLHIHVEPGAEARLDDNAIFTIQFDIPLGGSGSTGGGDTGGSGGNPPPTVADYKVAVAGDWGCENATDDVIQLIQDQGYDKVIGVGDNAYASSSCWISSFTPLKSIMNSAYGNHEYEESGGVTPYKTFFGHSLTYFTYKFENMMVIVCDTNINCDIGSTQHNAIKAALEASQTDNTIVWRIAVMHHPWFGASSQHSYNNANAVQNFMPTFITNKVNFVCCGHNHNWQRTHQVSYNSGTPTSPNIVDSSPPFSRTAAGLIHIVTGGGGHDSGSSLYSLGSQPGFQGYQNRTHNGVWELVATNGGNTLTCSFVDTNGGKYDTFVIENTGVTEAVDIFGIRMLNITKSNGRIWYNNWDNGHSRSWDAEPNGTAQRAEDPYDPEADFHCGPGNEAITVDGAGKMTMIGDNPRLYVNDVARVKKWNNVEMTVYYRAIASDGGASIHVHCRLAGRTEHQDEYLCAASGHTAGAFEVRESTVVCLRKEMVHPAYADDVISGTAAAPMNTWIGMKLVLRDEGGNTRIIGYRDTTDGASGGTWTEVVNKLDAGDWAFTDPTEIATYDAASDGSGTCNKITPRTSRLLGAANSCYLRCDGGTIEFKKFSIREINPT